MNQSIQKELDYLRDALDRYLAAEKVRDEVFHQQQHKRNLIREYDEGKTATNDNYSVFTATLDYFATGEGRTIILYSTRAASEADFLVMTAGKMGGYLALGADLFRGLPPADNNVADILLSDKVRMIIEREVNAPYSDGGHVDVFLNSHINYS